MKIINKTPHPVYILDENNEKIFTFNPAGKEIRLREVIEGFTPEDLENRLAKGEASFGSINGIPVKAVNRICFDEDLPKEVEGVYYIVSFIVAQAEPNRNDLLFPYDIVRDEEGRVIGCRSFGRTRFYDHGIMSDYGWSTYPIDDPLKTV